LKPATAGVTWEELRAGAIARLGAVADAELSARWLVEECAGSRWWRAAACPVTERARSRFETMVERRAGGEPLQYVIGRWGFRTLDLQVDRRVLIPRPETEQVTEIALAELDRLAVDHESSDRLIAVDLGTGSGAIALAIAAERAGVAVWATDISPLALEVAAANQAVLGGRTATRVQLALGRWWSALPDDLRGRVDLAVSNPPYIASSEMPDLDAQVSGWEPNLALEAGPTGLEAIEAILEGAPDWMRPGGVVVLEIAPHQAASAMAMARKVGFTEAGVYPDLAGRDRTLVARGAP
jgi:release factor glutamine methyltransferase